MVQGVYAGVKTTELDNLAAETAAFMSTTHPGTKTIFEDFEKLSQGVCSCSPNFVLLSGYGDLAARLAVSNLHKETDEAFDFVMEAEFSYVARKCANL